MSSILTVRALKKVQIVSRGVYDEFTHHITWPKGSKVQFTTLVVSTVIFLLSIILSSIDEIFICILQGLLNYA